MSLLSNLNYPPLVAAAGAVILFGSPFITTEGFSVLALKIVNVVALAVSVAAVSVPGRIDGEFDEEMRRGQTPAREALLQEDESTYNRIYSTNRGRTLLAPAPWAFAIWAVIYLGELAFVGSQFFVKDIQFQALIPNVTVWFVGANLIQSLWCASFRPSYNKGWRKYVSVAMLGGTAWSLFRVQATVLSSSSSLASVALFVPLVIHFGWTTAATLVNLNGSIALEETISDTVVIATGNASAVAAAAIGVTLTILNGSPTYGLTLAWALAGCASGMIPRGQDSDVLAKARRIQKRICIGGSVLSSVTAAGVAVLMLI